MYRSPERIAQMLQAVKCTSGKKSRIMRCPHCGHRTFEVFAGTVGYVKTKCGKCKNEITFDLVSMRRTRYPIRSPYGF